MTKKVGYKIRPDGKKDTGRPSSFTPETIQKFEYAFALGCTDQEACYYADVSDTALYNYQKTHPEFVEMKNRLKQRPVFRARATLVESIQNGDVGSAKWLLERRLKDEFAPRQELTGADGDSLQPLVVNILPVEAKNGDNSSDTE